MKKILLCAALMFSGLPVFAGTVLFIGDSHSVGPFGWEVDALLRGAGHKTATYASCGSIAQWWATGKDTPCGYFFRGLDGRTEKGKRGPTPIFEELLAAVKPDAVIVELGANYAGNPSDEFAIKDMSVLADRIKASGAACFWVTKPDSRRNQGDIPRILELTYKAVSDKCEVFDSTKVTKYPETGGDGIYYWFKEGLPIANAWARRVFEWASPGLSREDAAKPGK